MSIVDARLGSNYNGWVSKLKQKEIDGKMIVRAKCSYLGEGGVISRADLIELPAHLEPKVKKSDYTIFSDESKPVGGSAKYPSPLLYFLAGAGFCFLSTFAIHASARNVKIEGVDLDLKARFDLNGYYNTERTPVGLSEIDYDLRVKSPETRETIERLVQETELHCPVYQTLTNRPKINMHTSIS